MVMRRRTKTHRRIDSAAVVDRTRSEATSASPRGAQWLRSEAGAAAWSGTGNAHSAGLAGSLRTPWLSSTIRASVRGHAAIAMTNGFIHRHSGPCPRLPGPAMYWRGCFPLTIEMAVSVQPGQGTRKNLAGGRMPRLVACIAEPRIRQHLRHAAGGRSPSAILRAESRGGAGPNNGKRSPTAPVRQAPG